MAEQEASATTSASTGLGAASRSPSTRWGGPPAGPPRHRIPPSHTTSIAYSTGTPSGISPPRFTSPQTPLETKEGSAEESSPVGAAGRARAGARGRGDDPDADEHHHADHDPGGGRTDQVGGQRQPDD